MSTDRSILTVSEKVTNFNMHLRIVPITEGDFFLAGLTPSWGVEYRLPYEFAHYIKALSEPVYINPGDDKISHNRDVLGNVAHEYKYIIPENSLNLQIIYFLDGQTNTRTDEKAFRMYLPDANYRLAKCYCINEERHLPYCYLPLSLLKHIT